MKVAVFSDIHSNYHAFRACYQDALAQQAQQFIFLGDYISDLAEPRKTMDLVYEIQQKYPIVCLRGNRERYMLECQDGISSFSRGSKSGSLLYTYEHLQQEDLAFFRSLRICDTIEIGGVKIEIAHATADDDRHYFDNADGNTAAVFQTMQCNYLLTGHSHKQYVLHQNGKTIINPGSVGIPQGGTPNPKYAMLEIVDGNVSCTLREVTYDLAEVIHAQFSSGLVDCANGWAIGILYDIITGQEQVLKLLQRVQNLNNVQDEAAWHREAVRLGMKFSEQEILSVYHQIIHKQREQAPALV